MLEAFPHLGAEFGHRLAGMNDKQYAEVVEFVRMRDTEKRRELELMARIGMG